MSCPADAGSPVFAIEMLPAGPGDALWIEYGHGNDIHRVLVDGGVPDTIGSLRKRLDTLPKDRRNLELIVLTHIDADHIGGLVELLSYRSTNVEVRDIWFNGWRHLPDTRPDDRLGAADAELFTLLVGSRQKNWNKAFACGPVAVGEGPGPLPTRLLPGDLRLTVLSPSVAELRKLKASWHQSLAALGLDGTDWDVARFLEHMCKKRNGDDILGGSVGDIATDARSGFSGDSSPTNGSSIALLAEFAGSSCLLAGDGFAPRIATSLERLREERGGQLSISALKASHHGSGRNTSPDLIKALGCSRFLISTDSSGNQRHPDASAIARMITGSVGQARLYFNYRTDRTLAWKTHPDRPDYRYQVTYPSAGANGFLRVDLLA